MRSILCLFVFALAFSSCTTIKGVAIDSRADVQRTINIVCTQEMMSDIINKCSSVKSPQRWFMDEGFPPNYYLKLELYFIQIKPNEIDHIVSMLNEQPGVRQVIVH
jgi:hypothetical protein